MLCTVGTSCTCANSLTICHSPHIRHTNTWLEYETWLVSAREPKSMRLGMVSGKIILCRKEDNGMCKLAIMLVITHWSKIMNKLRESEKQIHGKIQRCSSVISLTIYTHTTKLSTCTLTYWFGPGLSTAVLSTAVSSTAFSSTAVSSTAVSSTAVSSTAVSSTALHYLFFFREMWFVDCLCII